VDDLAAVQVGEVDDDGALTALPCWPGQVEPGTERRIYQFQHTPPDVLRLDEFLHQPLILGCQIATFALLARGLHEVFRLALRLRLGLEAVKLLRPQDACAEAAVRDLHAPGSFM